MSFRLDVIDIDIRTFVNGTRGVDDSDPCDKKQGLNTVVKSQSEFATSSTPHISTCNVAKYLVGGVTKCAGSL